MSADLLSTLSDALASNWADHELEDADWVDQRLQQRSVMILNSFYHRPMASIPEACGSPAAAKAAYRFLENSRVSGQEILASHGAQTQQRLASAHLVLAVQDTTSLDHSTHPATEGLGPLNHQRDTTRGFFLHTTLAFSAQRLPLGLIQAQIWARDPEQKGKKKRRAQLPIAEKESQKWLRSYQACAQFQAQLPQTPIVNIGDRESDIFELFDLARSTPHGPALLVRAQQDRKLAEPEPRRLWDFLDTQPVAGNTTVGIRKQPKHPARTAHLEIRFAAVELQPPQAWPASRRTDPVRLWAVGAQEVHPPRGIEPVCWLLLTTLPVNNLPEALEKVQWYCLRWEIEVFHKILKSGCRAEQRQLKSLENLERCLPFDLLVAWRVHLLTRLGRDTPDLPATVAFAPEELQALYAFLHPAPPEPPQDLSLQQATVLVARLGGFLARKRDGHPGPITLWRGLQRLHDITWAFCAARSSPSPTRKKNVGKA